ncbi:MAG: hypothetical protein R2941_19600 [Desulfobacterales bacterium]
MTLKETEKEAVTAVFAVFFLSCSHALRGNTDLTLCVKTDAERPDGIPAQSVETS